ncbi:hypothetical protein DLAC_00645 [Tieghemostelium lacteum]|uniref:Uncharacterized protein n=1 Tax=Tieghemostelium lacteum TaxID=361077 RepID=A0A152AAI4_TIELA|nr:hypothetical protein DLAC_00645 [Tieghemostelium lacteum]|eukprot:KYR03145.1 hypothetical protein DLAC_00645 [Tieghemostelium lacteum]
MIITQHYILGNILQLYINVYQNHIENLPDKKIECIESIIKRLAFISKDFKKALEYLKFPRIVIKNSLEFELVVKLKKRFNIHFDGISVETVGTFNPDNNEIKILGSKESKYVMEYTSLSKMKNHLFTELNRVRVNMESREKVKFHDDLVSTVSELNVTELDVMWGGYLYSFAESFTWFLPPVTIRKFTISQATVENSTYFEVLFKSSTIEHLVLDNSKQTDGYSPLAIHNLCNNNSLTHLYTTGRSVLNIPDSVLLLNSNKTLKHYFDDLKGTREPHSFYKINNTTLQTLNLGIDLYGHWENVSNIANLFVTGPLEPIFNHHFQNLKCLKININIETGEFLDKNNLELLASTITSLTELSLDYTGNYKYILKEIFLQSICKNSTIETLKFKSFIIEFEPLETLLLSTQRDNSSLRRLDLQNCFIMSYDITRYFNALCKSKLVSIYFENIDQFEIAKGADLKLYKLLSTHCTLKHINLSDYPLIASHGPLLLKAILLNRHNRPLSIQFCEPVNQSIKNELINLNISPYYS